MIREDFILKKILLVVLLLNSVVFAGGPNYSDIYVGRDRLEGFNRKVFEFNLKINKYAIRPIHIAWASLMPQYGMDRIQGVCDNIEYPKRLVSTLLQKDFKASGSETVRFLTNTTIGLGGMFDPAQKFFHIKQVDEDMEQALSALHVKAGANLVLPLLMPSNVRGFIGKSLDTALNPSTYVVFPILALSKVAMTVNKTSSSQALTGMLENGCADPYDVSKKMLAIHSCIKCANLDRNEILDNASMLVEQSDINVVDINNEDTDDGQLLSATDMVQKGDKFITDYDLNSSKLLADMILFDYNPQSPIIDAMRTALLDSDENYPKFWNELSVWNRCFNKRIKSASVQIFPDREKYDYRYILQKEKNAPLAVIYPSIGEGVYSDHSSIFAKIFYDAGYSVLIQGSHFRYDFVKSMPAEYYPGRPTVDVNYLKSTTARIIADLQSKYGIKPEKKLFFGTSFGALEVLFLGDSEFKNNTFGDINIIAICPPVELAFAMSQVDKIISDWEDDDFKNRTTITAAKILNIYKNKDKKEINSLPFSDKEAKLITGFLMMQKLSDLMFSLENKSRCKCCSDFYEKDISYKNYANEYLGGDFSNTDLYSISEYLINSDNYKIYHSINDYLTNTKQLKQLKNFTGNKSVYLNNGSHLGFLYRQEFLDSLKRDLKLIQ